MPQALGPWGRRKAGSPRLGTPPLPRTGPHGGHRAMPSRSHPARGSPSAALPPRRAQAAAEPDTCCVAPGHVVLALKLGAHCPGHSVTPDGEGGVCVSGGRTVRSFQLERRDHVATQRQGVGSDLGKHRPWGHVMGVSTHCESARTTDPAVRRAPPRAPQLTVPGQRHSERPHSCQGHRRTWPSAGSASPPPPSRAGAPRHQRASPVEGRSP